jgi:lysophospholipase L1-like esterase
VTSPIEGCRDEGDEMDRRMSRLSKLDSGVHFLSLDGLVPHGDRSYHTLDLIHPSTKGSTEIGKRVAEIIRKTEAKQR